MDIKVLKAEIKYTKVYTKEKYVKIKAAQLICNKEIKIAMSDKKQIAYWRIAKAMKNYNNALVKLGLKAIPTK